MISREELAMIDIRHTLRAPIQALVIGAAALALTACGDKGAEPPPPAASVQAPAPSPAAAPVPSAADPDPGVGGSTAPSNNAAGQHGWITTPCARAARPRGRRPNPTPRR
ncbi:MAG: hypothetical protein B7Z20_00175 [Sphingobium sp. 32-64-5]|nr:MAG: hypothetical protein B7Z20_00175 [Sphingobium sp. 32-64-5]